jgi:hypothetical protein
MPDEKQAKRVNKRKDEQQKGEGKQYTRREALKNIAVAGTVVPLSSLFWQTGAQAQQKTTSTLSFDLEKLAKASQIIDRVAVDPIFRERVKAYPVETLAEVGVTLSPEIADALPIILKEGKQPDLLIKAMLGDPSLPQAIGAVEASIVPAVGIYVNVATNPYTSPMIQVGTRPVVGVAVNVVTQVDPGAGVDPSKRKEKNC